MPIMKRMSEVCLTKLGIGSIATNVEALAMLPYLLIKSSITYKWKIANKKMSA